MKSNKFLIISFLFAISIAMYAQKGNPNKVLAAIETSFYEGENNTSQSGGNTGIDNFPYTGAGYYDFGEDSTCYVEWNNIYAAVDGDYMLLVKYANSDSSNLNRYCSLAINGSTSGTMNFPVVYNDWSKWWIARKKVSLHKGNNTIRLTTGANNGPNIDNIAVSSGGLDTPGGTVIRPTWSSGNMQSTLQNAINNCPNNGSVVLDQGKAWMTGTIRLKSNMTLWIAKSDTLRAYPDTNSSTFYNSTYPVTRPNTYNVSVHNDSISPYSASGSYGSELYRSLIYSNGASNLTIDGGGVIDGNYSALDGNGDPDYFNGHKHREWERPVPVFLTQGNNITVRNIDIIEAAMWNLVPLECDYVYIDGINIKSNVSAENTDGIDICDSYYTYITNCTIMSEDDNICPKSGMEKGVNYLTVNNITINDAGYASAIKLGTKSWGSFKNLSFINVVGVNGSSGVSLSIVDGGDVDNITIENCSFSGYRNAVFILNGAGMKDRYPTNQHSRKANKNTGVVKNIRIKNLKALNLIPDGMYAPNQFVGGYIGGTHNNGNTYWVENVLLQNIEVSFNDNKTGTISSISEYKGDYPDFSMWGTQIPAAGQYYRHAKGISTSNLNYIRINAGGRPMFDAFNDVIFVPIKTIFPGSTIVQ